MRIPRWIIPLPAILFSFFPSAAQAEPEASTTTSSVVPYFNSVTNLTAVANVDGSVNLAWSAPTESNLQIYGYSVGFYDLDVIGGTTSGGWGAGTSYQGYAGGLAGTANWSGGGGGGAGGGGQQAVANTRGGTGGVGVAVSITGTSVTYGGGGGGGIDWSSATTSSGGAGGGGNGGATNAVGTDGTANTGGGAGGAGVGGAAENGRTGGSGVVILRWLTSAGTITVGAGLTADSTTTSGSYSIKRITAGSGNISWA